ncbi:alpha-N-acetylglucosaminidase (NAGLU) tim-barrel domain-containing protein [Phthorimaea operculella]|nr:alpha-N-acetylglucosaminidase (NAGLU) tim-barrel domain-containing protein [Phthorimaea operculella]
MHFLLLPVLFYTKIYSAEAELNLDYLDPTTLQTRTTISTQQDAAQKIILKYSDKVSVTIDTGLFNDHRDSFRLHATGGKLHISASTGVAAVWGFNYYLKKYCKSHIGWQEKRVHIPDSLPEADETVIASDRFRYYQNVCTFSYSFVWWNLTQWTEHIEWMALNGINLALAPVDQEATWAKVYRNIGMTEDEINKQFTGPAFLSWLRMGNIHGWGGPLYKSWHDRQSTIQTGVIKQMYDLGMIPVLPAFSGHVPKAFSKIYPQTKFHQVSDWNNFGSEYSCGLFLNPSDPLFKTIGQMFLRELTTEIMPSHIYSADPFNEVVLPNMTADVIESSAKAMFSAIEQVDKDAVWLVQNWMFVNMANLWSPQNAKAFLLAVPNGRMLVLDLEAEHNPKYDEYPMYYGQPFIWCMLHNFGGTLAALDAKVKNIKFDHDAAQHRVREVVERKFATVKIDWLPKGDPVELSRSLYKKWKNVPKLPDLPETSYDDISDNTIEVLRI